MSFDILPDARLRSVATAKNATWRNGEWWIPIYCVNCGADGGIVPEKTTRVAFYLCTPCADKWGVTAGAGVVPDEVFWAELHALQLERYGRPLTEIEIVQELDDVNSPLSRLARDRDRFIRTLSSGV